MTVVGNMPVGISAAPAKSAEAPRSLPYRPAIDGLRAVAVLSVLAFHLHHSWLPGGFVGVDIFFVISGFLITSILRREYTHAGFSPAKFYQRRIARLMPAFFTVALATWIGARFIYTGQDFASAGANLSAAALSIANFKQMVQGGYFQMSPDGQPFLHYWSLSVEEQFYVFFPVMYFLIFRFARKHRTALLSGCFLISLAACIYLTRKNATYAFYLLPTRAWELLAGAILADLNISHDAPRPRAWSWISLAGLLLVLLSLFVVRDTGAFPGFIAALPVIGTAAILLPTTGGLAEKILSFKPMVRIGRMSYSLYLWHWPVFSLVDYKLYNAGPAERLVLKLAITFSCTVLCYAFIESPGRVFLNAPRRRWVAFAFLLGCVCVFVPLGISTRRANFVNAEMADVARGGLHLNPAGAKGSMILMGDSHASMYGKMIRDVAYERGLQLTVISVSAGKPLPRTGPHASDPELWNESLAIVKQQKPDVLVLICEWEVWLRRDKDALKIALDNLEPSARHVILFTQPPQLPENANRQAIRDGALPPFMEDSAERLSRLQANAQVRRFAGGKVTVVDTTGHFGSDLGEVYFAGPDGQQLYFDRNHLSDLGANRVKDDFLKALDITPVDPR